MSVRPSDGGFRFPSDETLGGAAVPVGCCRRRPRAVGGAGGSPPVATARSDRRSDGGPTG
ncbi:hypothetical protein SSAG_04305 [Streptomyces sp. Mg1]|nr:hypothetical protein SSAG_04305 [Streptomyces sp. Mg1]